MDLTLHIRASFNAVYLINGKFFETATRLVTRADEVAYITVLPLSAALLPYTVLLSGGKVRSNPDLARAATLPTGGTLVLLSPRYGYVYSPAPFPRPEKPPEGIAATLFSLVRRGELSSARALLSRDLSAAVDDEALGAFFDEYDEILSPSGLLPAPRDCWLMVGKDGRAALFRFAVRDGLISDITEVDPSP